MAASASPRSSRRTSAAAPPSPPPGPSCGGREPCYSDPGRGGVAEWTNAPVLKTGVVQATVGSNPTPSATRRLCDRLHSQPRHLVMQPASRLVGLVAHPADHDER